jgi:hypothetical protein
MESVTLVEKGKLGYRVSAQPLDALVLVGLLLAIV